MINTILKSLASSPNCPLETLSLDNITMGKQSFNDALNHFLQHNTTLRELSMTGFLLEVPYFLAKHPTLTRLNFSLRSRPLVNTSRQWDLHHSIYMDLQLHKLLNDPVFKLQYLDSWADHVIAKSRYNLSHSIHTQIFERIDTQRSNSRR